MMMIPSASLFVVAQQFMHPDLLSELHGEPTLAPCGPANEELFSPHRMYCLVRLVQCAALNANRIRLVWGRLWAVVAPHLVSAACARCDRS